MLFKEKIPGVYNFELFWEKNYDEIVYILLKPSCMNYNVNLKILTIGFTNGSCELLRIKTDLDFKKFELVN
jgi:hypothetical protein